MLNENLNQTLDNLFYKEKLGVGNKNTFIKNVRDKHPEFKLKDIQEYIKNQERHHQKKSFKEEYKAFVEKLGFNQIREG